MAPPETQAMCSNRRTLCAVIVATLLAALSPDSRAHAPHDVIDLLELSPDYAQDGTVLLHGRMTERLVLARSTDHGRSWIVLGAPITQDLRALVFSPDFAGDQTVFGATGDRGLWRSEDAGTTWTRIDDGTAGLVFTALAISPQYATDRTLLAATPTGLYRSTDGGESFGLAGSGLSDTAITAVQFAPGPSGLVFAGSLELGASMDGGQNFAPLVTLPKPVDTIEFSPRFAVDQRVALAFGRFGEGVLQSIDGGQSFSALLDGLQDTRINDLALTADGALFAAGFQGNALRWLPGDTSWSWLSAGFEVLSDLTNDHARAICASPTHPQDGTVFVATFEGAFQTIDGGDTWAQNNVYSLRTIKQVKLSPDYAQDGLVVTGNYGGGPYIQREPRPMSPGSAPPGKGGGGSGSGRGALSVGGLNAGPAPTPGPVAQGSGWRHLGTDIPSLWSSSLLLSPKFHEDGIIFSSYAGLYRSTDFGQSFRLVQVPVALPRAIACVPQYPSVPTLFIGSSSTGTWRSDDDGATWALVAGLPFEILASDIDLSPGWPADPTMFVGTHSSGLWRSTDGGASWGVVTPPGLGLKVREVALSPQFVSDGVIMLATNGSGLMRSADHGDSWVQVNGDFPTGDVGVVESVAISPTFDVDQTVLAASMADGLYRSLDGGLAWGPAAVGLGAAAPRKLGMSKSFALDGTAFLTTYDWLWRTTDGALTWERVPLDARADDRHPMASDELFAADWEVVGASGNYGSALTTSNVTGARRRFRFFGDRATWFAEKGPSCGVADVFVDGALHGSYDTYAAQVEPQQPIVTLTFDDPGHHVIDVVVTGSKAPRSTDTFVRDDGFSYRSPVSPSGP